MEVPSFCAALIWMLSCLFASCSNSNSNSNSESSLLVVPIPTPFTQPCATVHGTANADWALFLYRLICCRLPQRLSLMDTNNWRPTQGAESTMDTSDWRAQLPPDSRHRIVNKIMDTLKRHLPVSGEEGLLELRKIAQRFEEKIYTAATSEPDYLGKISLKMLTMETKSQDTMANSRPSNPGANSNKLPDPGSIKE